MSTLLNVQRNNIIVNTGNILGNQNAKKPKEELLDSLKQTLEDEMTEVNELDEIHRLTDDLQQKIIENGRSNISIGAKIFLNDKSKSVNNLHNLQSAIEKLVKILKVEQVDNVILAYDPNSNSDFIKGQTSENSQGDSESAVEELRKSDNQIINKLKSLWSILEKYALDKKICRIGISDFDTEILTELHKNSKVHPSILQISSTGCCVVPQDLKEFCNQNDIQLLTHADDGIMLSDEDFPIRGYTFDWAVRYQIHIKCRGVLAAKGYIVAASKNS